MMKMTTIFNNFKPVLPATDLSPARQREILRLFWRQPGLSRKELAKQLHCSLVSAGRYTDSLLAAGCLEEHNQTVTGPGCPPGALYLHSRLFLLAGLHFHDGDNITAVLLNTNGATLFRRTLTVPASTPAEAKVDSAIRLLEELLAAARVPPERLPGIGVALTGISNPATGEVVNSFQFRDLRAPLPLRERLSRHFHKPCVLCNISHLLAWLEKRRGGAAGLDDFIYVHEGLGIGLYLNGRLYQGHQEGAGEFGLIQIARESAPHPYDGRHGTLEILGGINRLQKIYRAIRGPGWQFTDFLREVRQGDRQAIELLRDCYGYIARGVVNLAYLLNPEAIFLPPWTAEFPEYTLQVVQAAMEHYGNAGWGLRCAVQPAHCGDDQLPLGAAMLPMEYFFENELN